ncbi:hypothetical protein AB0F17_09955 [Nonomuraea sp. NPDC026600]|uniref:hypothetical protein n=1 Tax=Nonomuraea sp. NPDC026600 TaxID=3155363 RepID=UPI0033CC767E
MTATPRDAWDDTLARAFAVLLGKPVDEYDPNASYGVYYCCDDLSLELFKKGFDIGPVVRGELVRAPFPTIPILGELLEGWDEIAPHWTIDLGRSLFYGEDSGHGIDGLEGGLPGAELGRILVERGMKPADLKQAYMTVMLRAHTDGSLMDAMRVATGTLRGPDHLFPLEPAYGVDPRWDGPLSSIAHPGLSAHLRNLCRDEDTARADGAFYFGSDAGWTDDALPYPVVAGWRFGEAQAWSAVVRLPGSGGTPTASR